MDLPNITTIKKIRVKIKIIEMDLEECAIKNNIKHVCGKLDNMRKN